MNEQQFKPKTVKQKITYFWDYHKWKVLIPFAVLVFAVTFITSYLEETREPALVIAIVNGRDTAEAETLILEDYAQERGIDTEETPLRIESGFLHPKVMDETASADSAAVASIQKYTAMLVNGTVDVTISTSWAVEEYEKADAYCNLEELLPDNLYEELEGELLCYKDQNGKELPVGINLQGLSFLGEFYEEGTPVLTVSAYSTRKEETVAFIEWLLITFSEDSQKKQGTEIHNPGEAEKQRQASDDDQIASGGGGNI